MIKTLLAVTAGAALLSFACFTVLHALGCVHGWGDSPWSTGGPQTTRELPWAGGQRLDIAYPAQIIYVQGAQPRFTVTGPKDVVDALHLDAGVLRGPDRVLFGFGRHGHHGVKIQIVSPNTTEFHLSGAEQLDLQNYAQDSLTIDSSGAADVHGQGRAKHLNASLSGAGDLDLGQLPVDDAAVSISGAGAAVIDPHMSANVSISGAGHVDLKTRPPALQTHISGFGSVSHP